MWEGLLATCQGGGLHKHPGRLGVPRHSGPQLPGHSATQRVSGRQSLQELPQGQPQEVQFLGGLLELGLSLQSRNRQGGRAPGAQGPAPGQRGPDRACLPFPRCHPTRHGRGAEGGVGTSRHSERSATGGHPGLTSASAFRSCVRWPPSSFTTFLAPSATAASMRSRCLSSSASGSGPGSRRSALRPTPRSARPAPLLPASPGSGDPLASKLLIFIRSRATFSWLSRSICWAATSSFRSCGVRT